MATGYRNHRGDFSLLCKRFKGTRNPEKLNALNEYVADIRTGSLEGVTGSLSTPQDAQQLAEAINEKITPDVVIASIGGWSQGPGITDVPFDV